MTDTSVSQSSSLDDRLQIDASLRKIKSYQEANRLGEVIKLAEGQLSENTIRSWIKDPTLAHRAYKSKYLAGIVDKLPPIGDLRSIAYEIGLSDQKLTRPSQMILNNYKGKYRIIHDIPPDYAESFEQLRIIVKQKYNFFWTMYLNNGKKRRCDGFVFIRNSKLTLVGAGDNTSIHASLRLIDEDTSSFMGSLTFDDYNSGASFVTRVAIYKAEKAIGESLHEKINRYVVESHFEI